jgi:Flp pilus assembly protein TadG
MTTQQKPRDASRGQTLVEFALVIPVFLAILFGLVDLGRFVVTDNVLSQAAREGARLAAVEASWIGSSDASCNTAGGPTCPASSAVLAAHVGEAANRMVAGLGATITEVHVRCDPPGAAPTSAWTGQSCASRTQGNLVSVRVVFAYNALTPGLSGIVGPVTRQGAATMVIN